MPGALKQYADLIVKQIKCKPPPERTCDFVRERIGEFMCLYAQRAGHRDYRNVFVTPFTDEQDWGNRADDWEVLQDLGERVRALSNPDRAKLKILDKLSRDEAWIFATKDQVVELWCQGEANPFICRVHSYDRAFAELTDTMDEKNYQRNLAAWIAAGGFSEVSANA